ncbi:hypothetical protein F5Y04DRAFT_278672 [Hypomontagnella monticulosa]|nr:hypothetical protein F5Y04DRAFT_278672 [Hypomontagnella monticulosa]
MNSSSLREIHRAQLRSALSKNKRVARPFKDDPERTKNQLKLIYRKHSNLDVAAGDLAPIFGLGEGLLAKQRAQALFSHPEFLAASREFEEDYIRRRWDLPLGEWAKVYKLVHGCSKNGGGIRDLGPETQVWDVNHFYARFVMRAIHGINSLNKSATQLGYWLREAELSDQIWVLTHALMYLQLQIMREFKSMAPFKDRVAHIIRKS